MAGGIGGPAWGVGKTASPTLLTWSQPAGWLPLVIMIFATVSSARRPGFEAIFLRPYIMLIGYFWATEALMGLDGMDPI